MTNKRKQFLITLLADIFGCLIVIGIMEFFFPERKMLQILLVTATVFVITLIVSVRFRKQNELK